MGKSASVKKQKKTYWLSKKNAAWATQKKEDGIVASESDAINCAVSLFRILEDRAQGLLTSMGVINAQ